jgi:outer membrane immunogenic protein
MTPVKLLSIVTVMLAHINTTGRSPSYISMEIYWFFEEGQMNYKKLWGGLGIALASAVGLSVSAQAADLGRREPYYQEPAYVASTKWSGGYIGGHLGASWTSGSADLSTNYFGHTSATHEDLGETAFIGGIHGGYNFQAGAFVYGIEGDGSWGGNVDYLASIRGRFGVAANNLLFYGTAGVAFSGQTVSGSITNTNYLANQFIVSRTESYNMDSSQTGFVVGGGAEVKLSPNWSIGVEGLYYGFDGMSTHRNYSVGDAGGVDFNADAGADVSVVRGRISYHFDGGSQQLK